MNQTQVWGTESGTPHRWQSGGRGHRGNTGSSESAPWAQTAGRLEAEGV